MSQIKNLIFSFKSQLISDKTKYWVINISIISSAYFMLKAMSFLSRILEIRLLPVEACTLYKVTNMMLWTLLVLSNTGIVSGIMAEEGLEITLLGI